MEGDGKIPSEDRKMAERNARPNETAFADLFVMVVERQVCHRIGATYLLCVPAASFIDP